MIDDQVWDTEFQFDCNNGRSDSLSIYFDKQLYSGHSICVHFNKVTRPPNEVSSFRIISNSVAFIFFFVKMEAKRIKLSTDDDFGVNCTSGSTSTPRATTSDVSLNCNISVSDASVAENDVNGIDSGMDGVAFDPEILKGAKALYKGTATSVSEILDGSFQDAFKENKGNRCTNRRDLQQTGSMLHTYIHFFYKTFNDPLNVDVDDEYVRNMIAELKIKPTKPIENDKIYQLDGTLKNIHRDLYPELAQFYQFVNDNKMILFKSEYSISDKVRQVTGRCNALFRMSEFDDTHLMLFDWTRSTIMQPGSLSLQRKILQLNIYKYILEKSEKKKIVEMRSVVFHADFNEYQIIDIKDIGFSS